MSSQDDNRDLNSGIDLCHQTHSIMCRQAKMEDNKIVEWVRLEPWIRARKYPTRKHGVKQDMYFVLRLSIDEKKVQEALGWESKGMTIEKARLELAKRTGDGARTLRERRAQQKEESIASAQAQADLEKTLKIPSDNILACQKGIINDF